MPSIEKNRENWDSPTSWVAGGDEWSRAWGGSESMWHGSIFPRLRHFLPARHVLEIACGHGRVSAFLLQHCQEFIGVDLAPTCVATCRSRFAAEAARARFEVVDGRSLSCVATDSIDLAVSWDSLVHADVEAVDGYVAELARVLVPGRGVAFLHHANLADSTAAADPDSAARATHWRDPTVSAETVADACRRFGME